MRITVLTVRPTPIPLRRLTADRLASAIRSAVTDGGIALRAAELGAGLRAEDGVGNAAAIVDCVLRRR
jgi:sterol 3beta-glucosyltransferase